jgi:hypothetical protein
MAVMVSRTPKALSRQTNVPAVRAFNRMTGVQQLITASNISATPTRKNMNIKVKPINEKRGTLSMSRIYFRPLS